MASDMYEIVELANGDVVLQRADEDGAEPLLCIRFSPDTLSLMQGGKFDVAKAMIEAGMEAADELAELDTEDHFSAMSEDPNPVYH